MRFGSINVNGVAAFANSREVGAWQLLGEYRPDILCLQEVKGSQDKVWKVLGDHLWYHKYTPYVSESKGKVGYAGVAMLVSENIKDLVGDYIIEEVELVDILDKDDPIYKDFRYYGTGRLMKFRCMDFILFTVYTLNSGNKDELRRTWDELFEYYIEKTAKSNPDIPIYILGDLNVVSTPKDIWMDWNNVNTNMPGCKDYERNNFHNLLTNQKLVDTYRELHPDERKYSWSAPKVPISKGWRLDYALTNRIDTVIDSKIVTHIACSDHRYIELITKDVNNEIR